MTWSDFNSILIFDVIQILDKQSLSEESSASKDEKSMQKKLSKKLARVRLGRRKNKVSKKKNKFKIIPQK